MKNKLTKLYSKLERDDSPIAQALCALITNVILRDMMIVGDTQFDYQIDDETVIVIQNNKIIVCELNKETDNFEDTLVFEVK